MGRVLIADHHPVTIKGITSILSKESKYNIIGSVNDANDILTFLVKNEVDILILEIDIPNFNSISTIKVIKRKYPNTKILILSCLPEEIYALSAIKCGASGYITKTASLQCLLKAVNQAKKGGIYLNESISNQLITGKSSHNEMLFEYKKLSSREIDVLNLLSKGKRNTEIAKSLSINEKTVSTYKVRLLKKLNAQNIAELIKHAKILQDNSI